MTATPTTPDHGVLATAYRSGVRAAVQAGIVAEPEAQLTEPVPTLLRALATGNGLGELTFLRETQLDGVRPDFGILVNGRFAGWMELKAPGTGTDPRAWSTRNARQWERLSALDNLLICDGESLRLFRFGEAEGITAAALPYELGPWDAGPALLVLRQFKSAHPQPIRSASDLARALAPLARDLRERVRAGLDERTQVAAVHQARQIWTDLLHESTGEDQFADALAQVISYSLVIATLDGDGDLYHDGQVSIEEAERALGESHRVLAATLRPVLEVRGLRDALRSEIGALERLLGVVDAEAIARRQDPRGDPWLWFYEDFLEAYDPQARKNTGVYYTPVPVVDCITRLVEHVLVERFDLSLGFADESVVTLDPATGTGTFPLAVLDRAAERAVAERGAAGAAQVANGLAQRLYGFELLPGPYAVAHLRVGERLQQLGATLPPGGAQILLTDTLDTPTEDPSAPQLALFGAAEVLAEERRRARRVKREQRVMAIVGNPPYDRVRRDDAGGWVVHGPDDGGPALFDDVLRMANARTIFSHVASLYNLYAYFWRWAIWKSFEHHGDGPAVIGLITASSWLDAPGFVGLRELVRELCDEVWIVDLGGDNRGAHPEDNVFAIESPVAIAILVRHGVSDRATPATIRYRRISGTRREKLEAVALVQSPDEQPGAWENVDSVRWGSLRPVSGDAEWLAMPALSDLFPWQQPGCKLNRTWPVSPDKETLQRRWGAFLADPDPARRSALFPDPRSGRRVTTQVGDLPRLVDLPPDAPHRRIVRYGWRTFDRQWTFEDARLSKTESPSLWQSVAREQVFLTTLVVVPLGPGPSLVTSTAVPDMASFRGSYGGKDVIPLYRTAGTASPNVPASLLTTIAAAQHGTTGAREIAPPDLAAYVYALLSTPGYQERFAEQLADKVVRVPLSADRALWDEAVGLGRRLLWLHTFAERFADAGEDYGARVPRVEGIGWRVAVGTIPEAPADVRYDERAAELRVGDGAVTGVRPDVWRYSVSGWPVVRRWLEHRTRRGRGRRGSGLDEIRPDRWHDAWNDELLDLLRVLTLTCELRPRQDELLDRIVAGPLIAADALPVPTPEERAAPETIRPQAPGATPLTA